MRDTGIEIMGKVSWGTHFCQFYQDKQDLLAILVPFFKAGLEHNECCIWIISDPLDMEEARLALAAAVENLDAYQRNGQIEFLDFSDWYTVSGGLKADRVLHGWVDKLDFAQTHGFEGLRVTGNASWCGESNWQELFAYEAMIDTLIGQYRMLALCTYNLTKCGVLEIIDVVSNHACAMIKRGDRWQVIESKARKKIEASLHTSEQALMREHTFLEATIDLLPLPLAFFNTQGRLISDNSALRAWREQLDIIDRYDAQYLDPHTHNVIPESRQPVARALRGEIVRAEEYLVIAPGDMRGIPSLISAAPIRINGEIVAAVSIIEDITALKEADRAKDEFLAVLSHELHTPLTAMLGWSSLALDTPSYELMAHALEVVQRNAQRQKIIVDELLDASRLIHRKIVLALELTDLHTQTRLAVENMQQEAAARHLTLEFIPPVVPLPIRVDPTRLQQCIGNLLQNSLKFTPDDGTITVHCRREGNEALLSIHDTGRGINPEMLPTLFTIFNQEDRNERTGGLGLGLAVARGITELHGGRVWAESPGIGQGSTFYIGLPLAHKARRPAHPRKR